MELTNKSDSCPSGVFSRRELRWTAAHGRKSFLREIRVESEQYPSHITPKGVFPSLLVAVFDAPAFTRTYMKCTVNINMLPLTRLCCL